VKRSSEIIVRWLGGGVAEIATPDDKRVTLVDAWIWNNRGFDAFGIAKPAELLSPQSYVAHLIQRGVEAVLVALTHDHQDHIGDYFPLLTELVASRIDTKTAGQSDLMRAGLVQRFRDKGLDPESIVVNGGGGINFGGSAEHREMRAILVPAVHSTLLGYPAAGFVIEIGGVRVYCSGDTDLFSDLSLVGRRFRPDIALVCVGDGAFTMGPEDAVEACGLLGVRQGLAIHYAHSPRGLGVEAGERFVRAAKRMLPELVAHAPVPGASLRLAGRDESAS
jgi:L-ascorbate metabolism protein UlaG (beta-lactamase superfamily)